MSRTKIEWADLTINPVVGCSKCSPGCDNCYAERGAARMVRHPNPKISGKYAGVVDENGWTGKLNIRDDGVFADLAVSRRPKRVFVGSMCDLFHEAVAGEYIQGLLASMSLMPQHSFLLLTKRPERAAELLDGVLALEGFEHIWLGVTVCNQEEADAKIPVLLSIPAAKRFVSVEPMLGPVSLKAIPLPHFGSTAEKNALTGEVWIPGNCGESSQTLQGKKLDWVISGGETGPGARPMHPDWVRGLRDQCQEAAVPFFFKGWGGWMPSEINSCGRIGTWFDGQFVDNHGNLREPGLNMSRAKSKVYGHRLLDGREWNEVPA